MAFQLTPIHRKLVADAGIGPQMMAELMRFKATEDKTSPDRRQNLHGPFEEMTRIKTGALPADYYTQGDPVPWGLRVDESRSNILWQVVSGLMDPVPDLGAAYMALALDRGLGEDDYATELTGLHRDWARYLDHSGVLRDHHHQKMSHIYQSVSCPACSILTAVACRDPGMNDLFRSMLGLPAPDRTRLLQERGLAPLLKLMIPDGPGAKPV